MKKLIYLILFIPVIGFGQTYPHQIEPDTTHRMIMMTDTSVIDSPAMEFLYFSIDSLVEQIARDTLGLDSTYWSLDDSLSLFPVNQTDNIILGNLSGNTSMTGSYNFFSGRQIGNNLSTGYDNIAFGYQAGFSLNSGYQNILLGNQTGNSLVSSENNILLGTSSGIYQTGNKNVGIGYRSLYGQNGSSSGSFNVGIGSNSGFSTTGTQNVFLGLNTGYYSTGNYNLIFGTQSFFGQSGSTTGSYNVAIGYRSGYKHTTGDDNIFIGTNSGYNNNSGYQNTYLGKSSGYNNISGNNNVFIGYQAGFLNTGSNSIFLGYQTGYNETGSNLLYIDNSNTSSPLIHGDFSTDEVTINDDLYVNSLETSDYLYSTSDQILGGNWVDGDWTLTGNIDTLFFGDPSNIDTVIVSAGDPDQTLSFSDPDLTISGSGGNTIDISSVNYWDTNADGIYTLDNVGINTTPHATHPLYVVGTMWLDGPVRDGNGNFSGGTGNIMTANSSGEFLWESPSSISLSEFNNDLGLTQYWSLVGSDLFSNTGGAARDIIVGEIDMELPISGTPDQLMGRISSTGILNDINIGSGLSLSSGTLSATASSPWTDSGSYVQTTGSENVYIPDGEALLVGTTTESIYAVDIASTVEMRLLGDLYDKNSSNGAADDILTSDGDQIEWVTPEISLTPPVLMCYQNNQQSISSSGGFISVPNTVNDSGFGTSNTQKSVPLTGYYRVSAAGTVIATTGNDFNYAINGGVTVTQDVDTAGSYGFSYSTILYMTSGTTVGLYMDATSSGNNVDEISLDVNYIKS